MNKSCNDIFSAPPYMLKGLFLLLYLLCSATVYGVSAYPGIIKYRCADGSSVNLTIKGDETNKWAVAEDGYTLLRSNRGEWCYALTDSEGKTKISTWEISAVRPSPLINILQQIPKGLKVPMAKNKMKSAALNHSDYRSKAVGKQKTLVILMQYKDVALKKKQSDFDALFNQINYTSEGALGSVKDFFLENSHGQFDLTSDVFGPFTAPEKMNYYGGNDASDQDEHPAELFLEALNNVSSLVNLSDYDTDRDGYLNNVHIIFAGYGEEAGASADAIWSHEAVFVRPFEIQNVKITGYSCSPELRSNRGEGISRIGVHCHEMGHSFGALDYYDTDYDTNGEYSGTGQWDLMASGSWNNEGITPAHFNPFVKMQLGWADCETLSDEQQDIILPSAVESNKIYRINTETEDDYFLLENRQHEGFDQALPGKGMLIYHILPQIKERLKDNTINAAYPQTCYPVCAGAETAVPDKNSLSYGDVNSEKCPFPGKSDHTDFASWTFPAALSSKGERALVGIQNIKQEENNLISFHSLKEKGMDEGRLLFTESFETPVLSWSSEQIQGGNQWEVYKPVLLETTMPKAAEGLQYLMMKMEWKNMPLAISRQISPVIANLNQSSAFMSFKYQNQTSLSKNGVIKVLYKNTEQTDWQYVASISDLSNDWKQYRLELPRSAANFQIAFEAELQFGMILLDDVKVYSEIITSLTPELQKSQNLFCYGQKGTVSVESNGATFFKIYDLSGLLIYSCRLEGSKTTIEISPGFYIGVSENGVSKFYVY